MDLLRPITINSRDKLGSYDVEILCTNLPIEKYFITMSEKLSKDTVLSTRNPKLTTTWDGDEISGGLFSQFLFSNERQVLRSEWVANIYMEWSKKYAINTTQHKPKLWLRYVDDTFIIFNKGKWSKRISGPSEQYKTYHQVEVPFLDVLVKKMNGSIITYRKI